MNIEQIIQAGKFTPEFVWKWSGLHWYSIVIILICMLISALIVWMCIEMYDYEMIPIGLIFLIGGLFVLFGSCGSSTEFNKTKWVNEYVQPYYDSLPLEKHEVVFVKIDPEISDKVTGDLIFGSGYISTDTEKLTSMVVSYKDNGKINTYTNWVDAQMILTRESKPYIQYKRVPKNLGHGYDAGIYEIKVYLPENYKFTDIK